MHDDKTLKWFDRMGVSRPQSQQHAVTPDNIAEKLTPLRAQKWRLEGNKLIATTDFGEVVNFIPTNYICKGMDDKGMPILVKIGQ